MRKFSEAAARKLARKYTIDLDVVPLEEFRIGINIEREHVPYLKTVLNQSQLVDAVVNIALAHLEEDPRYYKFLNLQEQRRETYWSTRDKPSIYIRK